MESLWAALDPALAAKIIAILAILSGVKALLDAFGNKENKFVILLGKLLDVIGYNPKH
jgi:hypothetical protein